MKTLPVSVSSLTPENQSLAYYRTKVDAIELFIKTHYQAIEQNKINVDQFQANMKEIGKLKQEIAEMQKAISDGQVSIFDERQQTLKYNERIDELQAMKMKKQSQINELLPLLGPSDNDKIYFKDTRPEMQRMPLTQISQPIDPGLSLERLPISQNTIKITKHVGPTTTKPKNVLRAIYLPIEQSNTMLTEVEMIKAQIKEQETYFQRQLTALQEDNVIREEESRLQKIDFEEKLSLNQELLKRQENLYYQLSKQYFDIKYYSKQKEDALVEERNKLSKENEQSREQLTKTIQNTNQEINKIEKEIGKKSNATYRNIRIDMDKKDESSMLVKYEYEQLQSTFVNRIKSLEEEIAKKNNEYELYQTKRTIAMEAFCRDINNLKRNVKLYDEFIKTLQKNKDAVTTEKDLEGVKNLIDQNDKLERVLSAIISKGN